MVKYRIVKKKWPFGRTTQYYIEHKLLFWWFRVPHTTYFDEDSVRYKFKYLVAEPFAKEEIIEYSPTKN